MKLRYPLLLCLALAACSPERSDLKAELALLTKDLRGGVDPLPQVRPYEPFQYEDKLPDPFNPERLKGR